MDLLQRFAFLGRAIKDAGVSAKEASEAFKGLGKIMSQERPDDDVGRDSNGRPHVCPNCMRRTTWTIYDYNTMAKCNECQWQFDAHALENNHFAELRSQVLELQLRDRDLERERMFNQNLREAVEDIQRRQGNRVSPAANPPTRPKTPAEMTVRERLLRAQALIRKAGDLTDDELMELTEIAAVASNQNPSPINRSGSFRRANFPSIAPLRGEGIAGDEILMGNEETLMMEYPQTTDQINITTGTSSNGDGIEMNDAMTVEDIQEAVRQMEAAQRREAIERIYAEEHGFITKEMYEGFGFGGDEKPKKEITKPQKPLKRKLDL